MNEVKQFKIERAFRTTNYGQFRLLIGNRDVSTARINKIRESINAVGYVPTRIIVNEKMEIIDGQCRFNVFKEYGLPLYCDVIPGAGLDECRNMNINQSNWKLIDYVQSYANEGNKSYQYLFQALKQFHGMGISTVMAAFGTKHIGSNLSKAIKSGEFKCTAKDYERACTKLEWVKPARSAIKSAGGRTEIYVWCLFFAYDLPECNRERLIDKVISMQQELTPAAQIKETVEVIDRIYNKRNRGAYLDIVGEYRKAARRKEAEDVETV